MAQFYVWSFPSAGVAKIGETRHEAECRRRYAEEVVRRHTRSTEPAVLLLAVDEDNHRDVELGVRLRLRAAGVLPLWGRRDFYRLDDLRPTLRRAMVRGSTEGGDRVR